MEKVTSEKRRNVWTEVLRWDEDFPDFYPDIPPLDILLGHTPHSYINEVYTTYTTDEEKTRALADVYINIKPESSWQDLVETLYYENELAAVKEAKSFLQQNGKWYCSTASTCMCVSLWCIIMCIHDRGICISVYNTGMAVHYRAYMYTILTTIIENKYM